MHGELAILAGAAVGLLSGTVAALARPWKRLRDRFAALRRRFAE